jgi:hypothetical protein
MYKRLSAVQGDSRKVYHKREYTYQVTVTQIPFVIQTEVNLSQHYLVIGRQSGYTNFDPYTGIISQT